MSKIENKVLRLKHATELKLAGYNTPLKFKNGEEFHIVNDVLYMSGYPVSPTIQSQIIEWIKNNKLLFIGDTRKF